MWKGRRLERGVEREEREESEEREEREERVKPFAMVVVLSR